MTTETKLPDSWYTATPDQQIHLLLLRSNHLEEKLDGTHVPQYCEFCHWRKRVDEFEEEAT